MMSSQASMQGSSSNNVQHNSNNNVNNMASYPMYPQYFLPGQQQSQAQTQNGNNMTTFSTASNGGTSMNGGDGPYFFVPQMGSSLMNGFQAGNAMFSQQQQPQQQVSMTMNLPRQLQQQLQPYQQTSSDDNAADLPNTTSNQAQSHFLQEQQQQQQQQQQQPLQQPLQQTQQQQQQQQQSQQHNNAKSTSESHDPVVMDAPVGMTVAGVLFVPTQESPPGTQPQLVQVSPEQASASSIIIKKAAGSVAPSSPPPATMTVAGLSSLLPGAGMQSNNPSNTSKSNFDMSNQSDDNDSNGSASSGSGSGGNRNGVSTASYLSSSNCSTVRNDKTANQKASDHAKSTVSSTSSTSSSSRRNNSNSVNTSNSNSNNNPSTETNSIANGKQQQQQQGNFNSIFTPHVNAFLQQMGKDFTRPFPPASNQPASSQASQNAPAMVQVPVPTQGQNMNQQLGFTHNHPHAHHMQAQSIPHFVPIFDRSSPNGQPVLVGHQLTHMSIMPTDNMYDLSKRRFNTSSSKYRGVSWHRRDRKWLARTWINGRIEHLGCFRSEEMAALAVDLRTIEHFGESRKELNFPDPHERKRLKEIFSKTGEFKLRSAEDLAQRATSNTSSTNGKASSDGNGSTSGSKETSETDTPPSEAGNATAKPSSKEGSTSRSSQGSTNTGSGEEDDSGKGDADEAIAHSVGPKISVIERDKSDYSRVSDSSSNGSTGKRSQGSGSPTAFHNTTASKRPSSSSSAFAGLPPSKRSKSDPATVQRKKSAA